MPKTDLEALEYDFAERVAICLHEGKLDAVRGVSVAWRQVSKDMEGYTLEEKQELYKKWRVKHGV